MGANSNGQLGNGASSSYGTSSPYKVMNEVKQVSCGRSYSMIIDQNNILYACGNNSYGQFGNGVASNSNEAFPVKIMEGVKQVACGLYHTMIIKTIMHFIHVVTG